MSSLEASEAGPEDVVGIYTLVLGVTESNECKNRRKCGMGGNDGSRAFGGIRWLLMAALSQIADLSEADSDKGVKADVMS